MPPTAAPQALASGRELFGRSLVSTVRNLLNIITLSFSMIGSIMAAIMAVDMIGLLFRQAAPDYRLLVQGAFSVVGRGAAVFLAGLHLAALLAIVTEEEQELLKAFRAGMVRSLRLFWVLLKGLFAIAGGTALGVVPGVVMAVWFIFAPLVCVVEGVTGSDALSGSREFFRGRTFAVLGRVAPALVPLVLLPWVPVVGPFAACFYMPCLAVHLLEVYNEVKPTLGTRAYAWPSGRPYMVMGFMGNLMALSFMSVLAASRAALYAPPDSFTREYIRSLRVYLSDANAVLDRTLSHEGKEAWEEAGHALVGPLGRLETKLKDLDKPVVKVKKAAPVAPAAPVARKRYPFESSRDPLIRLLGDPDAGTRLEALKAISQRTETAYILPVEDLTYDPSAEVRRKAEMVLRHLQEAQTPQNHGS